MKRDALTILMADDDADDRQFTQDALVASRLVNALHFVEDGVQLMDYLRGRGAYTAPGSAPRPGLILLDLNMPKMDGREALKEIKSDPGLRRIPVVVLTTSKAEEDILRSYEFGANSFIAKPVTFEGLVKVMDQLGHYWFELVELPPAESGA
jgi:CheY-like chemotaxis protein